MIDPSDLTIVIPTRDRWSTLRQTLDALDRQTVHGFSIVVVVDGEDQVVPDDVGSRVQVVTKAFGGSGAARNRGLEEVTTSLTMLLDDDMVPVPETIGCHLARHREAPEAEVAVLGRVIWHPDLEPTRISRWLDWSSLMFDYHELRCLGGTDVGWGRFFSCHVSFKTDFVRSVGGFDERFLHYYEDTELAKRLGDAGVRVIYEPAAVTQHLQHFDWASVRRRMDRVALGERLMVHVHDDFEPWYLPRMERAVGVVRRWAVWSRLVDHIPQSWERLRAFAEFRANLWYLSRLAPSYIANYTRAGVLCELIDHLGDAYDPAALIDSNALVEAELAAAGDEITHYRTSGMYLYDLTAFELSGTKEPYRELLARHVEPGARLLDYGCGIGSDGLAFADAGFEVAFADFDNPSVAFLGERLERRGRHAEIYDVETDLVPDDFDAAFSFDVIEHVDDPVAFLRDLESRARVVAVNFLEPDPHDPHMHRPLPLRRLIAHVLGQELRDYRRLHDRSHVVVYRTTRRRPFLSVIRLVSGAARSLLGQLRRVRP